MTCLYEFHAAWHDTDAGPRKGGEILAPTHECSFRAVVQEESEDAPVLEEPIGNRLFPEPAGGKRSHQGTPPSAKMSFVSPAAAAPKPHH